MWSQRFIAITPRSTCTRSRLFVLDGVASPFLLFLDNICLGSNYIGLKIICFYTATSKGERKLWIQTSCTLKKKKKKKEALRHTLLLKEELGKYKLFTHSKERTDKSTTFSKIWAWLTGFISSDNRYAIHAFINYNWVVSSILMNSQYIEPSSKTTKKKLLKNNTFKINYYLVLFYQFV